MRITRRRVPYAAALALLLALACTGCAPADDTASVSSLSSAALPSSATSASIKDNNLADLEASVSRAILSQYGATGQNVCNAEGHVLLGTHKKKGIEFVYAVISFGTYRYENGAFTRESGFDAEPVIFMFSRNTQGEHKLLQLKTPPGGSRYSAAVDELFPEGDVRKEAEDPAQFRAALDEQIKAYQSDYTENAK